MKLKTLRIAIISDLHCHPNRTSKEDGENETYLITDKLRSPSNDHPVDNLVDLIRDNELSVDLTLCPGDFTDKANQQGFISGWGFSLEISRELGAPNDIIATLGNHDVDVYNTRSNYSLEMAQGIKRGFPISSEAERDIFWAKGCVFIEKADYRILVINSSHFHHNKASSKSGKVGDDLIEYVQKYLSKVNDDKFNIAMSHHHPVDHSGRKLGELDKIVNGDALLDVLGIFKFDLFIHGHKHDALLRYHNTTATNYKIPIFSAGSFSSCSTIMFTGMRNLFHIVTLTKDTTVRGEIETWTYFPNSGWQINCDPKGFAPYSGFGNLKSVAEIFEEIKAYIGDKGLVNWNTLKESIPDLNNLIPSDSLSLSALLKDNGYNLDEHIWDKPNNIYNLNKLQP